ncbi:hypothetical protein NY2A_b290R [Paramecium bursaria Chlorella virus NY2A]|uniref:Uncharacterized protein b290R n=1 Tax=Paramecium bursaria Chlorella virus NY2A TaxID=46021 RepID=A7IWG5_PBCVN|nr:hypothetical protein NY2A_b290R [Paramecium bursaria Chlorella virus NY2A]ABT14689.1 hypothetical protein NY2A_b290R [Paramecium bursaria Chlorella virus NY2A]
MNSSANSFEKYLYNISRDVNVDKSFLIIFLYVFLICFTAFFISKSGSRLSTIAGPEFTFVFIPNFFNNFTRVLFSGTAIPAPHLIFVS